MARVIYKYPKKAYSFITATCALKVNEKFRISKPP